MRLNETVSRKNFVRKRFGDKRKDIITFILRVKFHCPPMQRSRSSWPNFSGVLITTFDVSLDQFDKQKSKKCSLPRDVFRCIHESCRTAIDTGFVVQIHTEIGNFNNAFVSDFVVAVMC